MDDSTGTSLRCLIVSIAAVLLIITTQLRAADITLQQHGQSAIVSGGQLKLQIHLDTGLVDYIPIEGPGRIIGASAGLKFGSGGSEIFTTQYPTHAIVAPGLLPLDDKFGRGEQLVVRHTDLPGSPQLDQVFKIYSDKPIILTELRASSSESLQSNWMAPLIVPHAAAMTTDLGRDIRLLQVPWDNDEWVRLNARRLDASGVFSDTGFEFTTIFDVPTHRGWVIGSVTHDFWKTGIDYHGGTTAGHINALSVFGGVANHGTHDVGPHGAMVGSTIESPTIFVGYFNDFRDGLEEFGHANAAIAPPLAWHGDVPVGWMSFGAVQHVDLDHVLAASDYLHQHLQSNNFCDAHGRDCINIDANHLSRDQLQAAVDHIHENHQLAGCYFSPFLHWHHEAGDPLQDRAGDTGFTIGQLALRDDHGNPIEPKDRAVALDVSNPATMQWLDAQIGEAKKIGFDYFKLDFLSSGALEGKFHDPSIHSGIQAYNRAMQHLIGSIGKNKFVSLSIAPMFPSQYGHSRRISCDIYSQLNNLQSPAFRDFGSTEYMLNGATFLWWMGGTVYPYNDPDAIELNKFQDGPPMAESWAKARIISAIVSGGTFLDADDFSDATAAQRAQKLLTNPRINAIARRGIAFRPLFHQLGNQWEPKHDGTDSADVFYRADSTGDARAALVAVFNFDPKQAVRKSVLLDEVGLPSAKDYQIIDLWTGQTSNASSRSWQYQLPAGEATLVRISEAP